MLKGWLLKTTGELLTDIALYFCAGKQLRQGTVERKTIF